MNNNKLSRMLPFHTHFAPLLYPLGKKSVPLHFKRRFLEEKKIKEKLLLLKLFTQAKLHNAEHYSTNVLYEKNGNTSVFDIMSQPFYDLTILHS